MTLTPPWPGDHDRGVFPVLAVPWGEPPQGRPDTGRAVALARGQVRQPAELDRVMVNLDHDPGRLVGQVLDLVTDQAGLWALVKLGRTARELVKRGARAVSAETDRDSRLSGLALVTHGLPVFASARVFEPARGRPVASRFRRPEPVTVMDFGLPNIGRGGFALAPRKVRSFYADA